MNRDEHDERDEGSPEPSGPDTTVGVPTVGDRVWFIPGKEFALCLVPEGGLAYDFQTRATRGQEPEPVDQADVKLLLDRSQRQRGGGPRLWDRVEATTPRCRWLATVTALSGDGVLADLRVADPNGVATHDLAAVPRADRADNVPRSWHPDEGDEALPPAGTRGRGTEHDTTGPRGGRRAGPQPTPRAVPTRPGQLGG